MSQKLFEFKSTTLMYKEQKRSIIFLNRYQKFHEGQNIVTRCETYLEIQTRRKLKFVQTNWCFKEVLFLIKSMIPSSSSVTHFKQKSHTFILFLTKFLCFPMTSLIVTFLFAGDTKKLQSVSRIYIFDTRWLFLSQFWPLLKQATFLEAAGTVAKISSSLKPDYHKQI